MRPLFGPRSASTNRTLFTRLKIAVLAPIPSPSVAIMIPVSDGLRDKARHAALSSVASRPADLIVRSSWDPGNSAAVEGRGTPDSINRRATLLFKYIQLKIRSLQRH